MIVMKFGGSSVESARAIQRVASIVRDYADRQPAVVVSAMGKTTDQLLSIGRLSAAGKRQDAGRDLARLQQFHQKEASCLVTGARSVHLDCQIGSLFDELQQVLTEVSEAGCLTPRLSDAVLSFGERLSSVIVTAGFCQAGIDAVCLDARTVIVTDAQHTRAVPFLSESNAMLRRKVLTERVTVMGGFIAATEDGVPSTLGRGGSDYTAAIVGAALNADEIQIWTDVDGMLTCDPRLVANSHCLRSISYAEAEQLAKAGAKVLHPATVLPAIRQRIPIVIRNSRNPVAPGTRILNEHPSDGVVLSIACRKALALIHLVPRNTPVTGDFGSDIWDVFQKAGVSFELIATSRREISLMVDEASLTQGFRDQLAAIADIEVQTGRALLTLVGHNVSRNPSNLARASLQLRNMAGGAILGWCSDSRFAFVVEAQDVQAAAEALHNEFFAQADPTLVVPNRTSVRPVESLRNRPSLVRFAEPAANLGRGLHRAGLQG
jgi:aspartate kinase